MSTGTSPESQLLEELAVLRQRCAYLQTFATEHWHSALAHHQTAMQFRTLIEESLQGILIHRHYKPLFVNQAWAEIFGYKTPLAVLQMETILPLIAPADRQRLQHYHTAMMSGQAAPAHYEFQGVQQNGIVFWLGCKATQVPWEEEPASFLAVSDITSRKQAEMALRQSEERFRDLIEGSIQGIVIHRDMKPVFANQAYADILGYDTPANIMQLDSLRTIVAPQEQERMQEYMQAIQNGRAVSPQHEHRAIRKDGRPLWLAVQARKIQWDGAPAIQATVFDVTERKRTEADLQRSQQRLQKQQQQEQQRVEAELAKARDQLVTQARLSALGYMAGTIAHELRNPLGAARNAAYSLRYYTAQDHPMLLELLRIIEVEISAADQIIHNLLEMSRAKQPITQDVNLAEVAGEVWRHLRDAEAIRLQYFLDPDPFVVQADPEQLRQVLTNLLTNAIEAMQGTGEISISGQRDAAWDILTFQDSGPGIPVRVRERLFEPLVSTKAKGTGLGLTICRQIVEQHGGTMALLASPVGAVFRLMLPRRQHMAPTPSAQA